MEVGVGDEGFVVEPGEVWLGAPAGEIGFEVGELGEGLAEVAPDGGVASLDFGEALEVEGSLVKRGQFGLGEGPAAFRNFWARVKSRASSSRIWPPQRTVVPPLTRMRPVWMPRWGRPAISLS
jgi:hypothetical protein